MARYRQFSRALARSDDAVRRRQARPTRATVALLSLACAPYPAGDGPELSAASSRGAACARIFSTNDTHGRLLPAEQSWSEGRLVGGSAAMAGYANEVRRSDPDCPVFMASGGDFMQGTLISNLTEGRATIEAMNAIGYDVAALGNHEFDWGVDVLEERIADAEFAMLGANIFLKGTDRHPDWVRPWTIIEKDGVRVGFVGMITLSTPTSTRPSNVVQFEFRSIAEALDRYIPEVRAEGVDFVVAVMHEGAYCQIGGSCEGEAIDELSATNERFDYAVTGHTHSPVETHIDGVPVIQSFSNSVAFGLGRLERDAAGEVQAELIGVRRTYVDAVEPDPAVAAVVARYEGQVAHLVDQVVARFAEPLGKPRRGDFALGWLIADAQRARLGTQVALMNNGGIRRPLPAGEITYADLFELHPFGNTLVKLTMRGADLLAALEHGARDEGPDLQVSGITIDLDMRAPRGSRVRGATLDDGTEVVADGTYTVTVNDFLAVGGSGYVSFLEAVTAEPSDVPDLDALVEYLERLDQPVVAPEGPRWLGLGPR